jgi:hypothetical protein
MTEIKISPIWKERIVYWCRDLVIVFGMWSIWLINVYMPDIAQKIAVTVFIALIIAFTIVLGEYYRVVDYTIRSLEEERDRIKNT